MGRTGIKFYGNDKVRVDEDFRDGFTHTVNIYDEESGNWLQLGEPLRSFEEADTVASKFGH